MNYVRTNGLKSVISPGQVVCVIHYHWVSKAGIRWLHWRTAVPKLFILFWQDVDGRLLPVLHQHVDLPRGEHELLLAAEDMGRNGDTQRVEGTGQSRRLHKQQGNLPQQPPGKTMVYRSIVF